MRQLTDLMSSDLPSIAEWIGISCALFHNNGLQIVLLLSHDCKLYSWIFTFNFVVTQF